MLYVGVPVLSNQALKDNKSQQRSHDKQRPQNVLMSENSEQDKTEWVE